MPSASIQIRPADLHNTQDASAVIAVLDSYASDPVGGGEPLSPAVRARLIPGLRSHPTSLVLLALDGAEPVGLAVCFFGFSTFRALPLLNIHDLAIVPARRGQGIGHLLLQSAEEHAQARNCCKLTLEVQDDNQKARRLYERAGFRDVIYGNSGPTRFLAKLLPCMLMMLALLLPARMAFADTIADVEAATQQWIAAFNHKDARGITALYANDAVFFGTSSPLLRDRPELVRDYFKSLPSLGDAMITLGEHRVQLLGKLAISTGFYTRSAVQDGKTVTNPARFTFVYAKRGGQWLIVNHHSSALPAP